MKEAAAFMHMEQGTDSNSVVQSDYFVASRRLNNTFRQLNKQRKKRDHFLSAFFKLKRVKSPLHNIKYREILCEVQ